MDEAASLATAPSRGMPRARIARERPHGIRVITAITSRESGDRGDRVASDSRMDGAPGPLGPMCRAAITALDGTDRSFASLGDRGNANLVFSGLDTVSHATVVVGAGSRTRSIPSHEITHQAPHRTRQFTDPRPPGLHLDLVRSGGDQRVDGPRQ